MRRAGPSRAVLAALTALLLAAPLAAQPDPRRAEEVRRAEAAAEAAREAEAGAAGAAREAEAEEEALAARRAEAGRRAVETEAAVQEAGSALDAAEATRSAAEAERARRAGALGPLLPALRRLGLWPAETLLVVPLPPEEALRGALVLRRLARRLEEQAAAYRDAEEAAHRAVEALRAGRARLDEARSAAAEAEAAVEAALAEARARRESAGDAEQEAVRRAALLAARAADLRAALDRLEREAEARAARARAAAEARAAAAEARRRSAEERAAAEARAAAGGDPATGRVRGEEAEQETEAARQTLASAALPRPARGAPVAGAVSRDFGTGGATGQTWSAPGGARVVSPCAGRVVFAGPFRTYGRMLIVDCGGGYHFVLAGLGRLDASLGQRLAAGEAVGALEAGGRGSLYLELRRGGRAVDPRAWTVRG